MYNPRAFPAFIISLISEGVCFDKISFKHFRGDKMKITLLYIDGVVVFTLQFKLFFISRNISRAYQAPSASSFH